MARSKPITICLLTFPKGGPYVWAVQLAKKLEKKGYEVTVATGRKSYLREQFRRYDILHTCVATPFCFSKKLILTIHGDYTEEKLSAKMIYPLTIAKADRVTVPSEFLRKAIGVEAALVIPNGIDIPTDKKKDYTFLGNGPTLGILTNFSFRKKAEGLVHLARIIHRLSPQATLVVGGDGTFFDDYRSRLLAIHPGIEFLGHCKKEDLFEKVDIFTYYSFLDNQPIAVLEAMAYGLPVVSNEVGAIREIMTDGLEQFVASSDEVYQRLLHRLLGSEIERRQSGEEARRVAGEFSWDKIVEQFIQVYGK